MRLTEEFPSWAFEFIELESYLRKHIKEEILKELSQEKNGETLVAALNDQSQMQFRGFAPVFSFLLESGDKKDLDHVFYASLSKPCLIYAFRNFPAYIVVGKNLEEDIRQAVGISELEVRSRLSGKVHEFNSWVLGFLGSSTGLRKKWRSEKIINGLKEYMRPDDNDNKAGKKFVNALKDHDELRFCCYAPNIYYVLAEGKECFIHPFGGASIVFEYKNFPALLVTSPSLRFDESYINEHKQNTLNSVFGFTD